MNKRSLFFLTILLTISACAPSVTIRRTVPARFHISGINSIVFTPFTYETSYHEEGSNIIPEVLEDALRENGFFEVARMPAIDLKMDEKLSLPRIKTIGRRAKVDAVITGKVMAFQATHDRKETPVEKETPDGKKTFYETSMSKSGEVSFYADLYSTQTGKHLDHKYFTRIGTETAKGREEIKKMSSDDRLLRGVAEKLANKIVAALTPHEVKQKITFKNDKPCKDGVKLARNGNWNDAEASWRSILSSEPNRGCALYNLALSHEVKKEYPQALDLYKKASALDPEDKTYALGVKRTKNMIRGEKILKRQLKGRE